MPWVYAALAVISVASLLFGGKKAGDKAKEASGKKAKQELELTLAKTEDLKIEERALKGQTLASVAGAGVKVGMGSPLEVLAEQARNFQRERQTVARVGATNASVISQQGKNVASQAKYQSYQQASNTAMSAFGSGMLPKYLGSKPGPG